MTPNNECYRVTPGLYIESSRILDRLLGEERRSFVLVQPTVNGFQMRDDAQNSAEIV